ncbi:single-stranded DNA-binding protein [uncultured Tyzzerella sp.]|uniref:single-stranded DNA-binding protein n=1 Tax=uncultured Tyzzerella sp. TaxID=2321398 RepID=UPI00294238B3|nr:single-stranded DNA-binding protein [uncultured Tyzzerella sp.]
MNKSIFSGRLTANPEIKYSQGVEPIAILNFALAVERKYKKEEEPNVDFVNFVAFGKIAEFISKYCTKGKKIGIIGYLKNKTWKDENNKTKTFTEFIVEEVELLDKKENTENESKGITDEETI